MMHFNKGNIQCFAISLPYEDLRRIHDTDNLTWSNWITSIVNTI